MAANLQFKYRRQIGFGVNILLKKIVLLLQGLKKKN